MTVRPPNLSVQMPSGRRNNAPVKTGVEVSRPNSKPFRPSSRLMGMPITPNINHTAKHTTNDQVVTARTRMLLRFDMIASPARRARDDRGLLIALPSAKLESWSH